MMKMIEEEMETIVIVIIIIKQLRKAQAEEEVMMMADGKEELYHQLHQIITVMEQINKKEEIETEKTKGKLNHHQQKLLAQL